MKTLIAIPAMEQMHSLTVQCLANLRQIGETRTDFIVRMPVDMARNTFARRACEEGFTHILWIDSDMMFEPDLMERLAADLEAGYDIVTGLYFKRKLPPEPVIYKNLDFGHGTSEIYFDYPQNALFPVAGCGFGGLMMKTEVVADTEEPPFDLIPGYSEDLSFCIRMAEKGRKIGCDSRIKLGHLGTIIFGEKLYRHPNGGDTMK